MAVKIGTDFTLRSIVEPKEIPSFYFAGKISKEEDWREPLLSCPWQWSENQSWITAPKGILKTFSYEGPFSSNSSLPCRYNHGFSINIPRMCRDAIERADIVFAWIEDSTAYATLYELGFAKALRKRLWMAGPVDETGGHSETGLFWRELWFIRNECEEAEYNFTNPKEAFAYFCKRHDLDKYLSTESPMETALLAALGKVGLREQVQCQYSTPPYRLDFAFPDHRLGIEVDGHQFHSSKEQRQRDAQRDRELAKRGWMILRFTGSEVFANADQCAAEIAELMQSRQRQ